VLCALALAAFGCTRRYYRDYADSDVYGILKERLIDWRWRMPERPVEADPRSRMADLNDPNHVPIVPDEVASRRYQVSARFPFEFRFWNKRGTTPIEDLSWQPYLSVEPDGKLLLSKDAIMRVGMVNSREYQFAYESLYLAALQLTLARFQFMIQGYSIWNIFYSPLTGGTVAAAPTSSSSSTTTSSSTSSSTSGSSTAGTTTSSGATTATATATPKTPNLNNQLLLGAQNGFTWELMSGAQLLVNLANSLVFEYSNHGVQMVSPSLTVSLTQPFLAGAWARIVTQPLSLQERGVLYALRSFAEFRRQFYVALVTGQSGAQYSSTTGYLGLVGALQSIRNQEINVKSTKRNLDIYEAENRAGFLSILERDTVAQQYQTALATLLSLQAGLQTQLDAFKINLGLPTELEVRIDDSILDQFELTDERLDAMRDGAEALFLRLLQNEALPRDELANDARELKARLDELEKIHDLVVAEHGRWRTRLKATRKQGFSGPDAEHAQEIFQREERLAEEIEGVLLETDDDLDENQDEVITYLAKLGETTPADATKALRLLVGKQYRARISEVSVAQTQIRVFSIGLPPVDLTVNQALQIALGNRLDLQNALGAVTDAWRQVEFDANQLQSVLNFQYNGIFNESPYHAGLFRFDSSNSIQTFGLQFQAPINRRLQRNNYRADQIAYQRARRMYMQTRDTVVQQIRLDMRQLTLQRRVFEINREQIIIAARQLEIAEYNLRAGAEAQGQNLTYLLLQALTSVLNARNALITSWISYETARMTLYRDFDLMDIDSNGVWTNENDPTAIKIALRNAECAPALGLGIPARIPDLGPNVASDSTFYVDIEPGGKPNQPPDAARDSADEGPLTPSELRGGPAPAGPARPGGALPATPPARPSPFAPTPPGP
jgi:outer membrane protein TolC